MLNKRIKKSAEISLRGFTLLELLIVIAILAILTTVVVLVLNPAEYLAQARDSQRISDLNTLNNAINLYIASISTLSLTCGGNTYCTASGTIPGGTTACVTVSSSTLATASGWVPIDFNNLAAGSPIAKEPIDPINNTTYKYAYACSATTNLFELDANMESAKYRQNGGSDLESNAKDGGNNSNAYEVGSDLLLIPAT